MSSALKAVTTTHNFSVVVQIPKYFHAQYMHTLFLCEEERLSIEVSHLYKLQNKIITNFNPGVKKKKRENKFELCSSEYLLFP